MVSTNGCHCRTHTTLIETAQKHIHCANGSVNCSAVFLTKNRHPMSRKQQQVEEVAVAKLSRLRKATWLSWSAHDAVSLVKNHPIPCVLVASLLFFMGLEYTLRMVPPSSPPFDLGFALTRPIHSILSTRTGLNSVLAGLNTVFVGMQLTYILWTWAVEGRPRATIAALFMFTCRGILGYSTQLPLPQGYLGSGMDFPVGNVSFFLFFSGHVAGSIIASLDMRRMHRWEMAWTFQVLNVLQVIRLLATRGHYSIDLATGIGAGWLFDSVAGIYEESKRMSSTDNGRHQECYKEEASANDPYSGLALQED